MFKDLSLEYRNIQTQNCAPIQCTVWPRNDRICSNPLRYVTTFSPKYGYVSTVFFSAKKFFAAVVAPKNGSIGFFGLKILFQIFLTSIH